MKTLREYIDRLDEISRRDFLKGAGATAGLAAGSALGQTATAQTDRAAAAAEKAKLDQLARLRAAAGAEGERGGTVGDAISLGYADKVRNKIKPFIVFDPATLQGNPAAVILVDLAPDGTILNTTTVKSSGSRLWDAAVLTALDNAKTFPKDDNGQIPMRQMRLTFKPKD